MAEVARNTVELQGGTEEDGQAVYEDAFDQMLNQRSAGG